MLGTKQTRGPKILNLMKGKRIFKIKGKKRKDCQRYEKESKKKKIKETVEDIRSKRGVSIGG